MTKTEHFGLNKQTQNEFYNVDLVNENSDIIDAALKKATDSAATANKKADELENKLATTKADIGTINNQTEKVQYDLAEVIFQLSVKDMTDNSTFRNVIVDKIDSKAAVNLVSGSYASGKVYI
nr:MAG TPA: hypothetical protein [Caudoviricetes sp.]